MYRKDNILKKIFILILTIAIIFSFSPVAYGAASYLVQVNNVAGRSDVLIYVDGQFEKILSLGSQHTAYYPDGTGIEVVAFDYVGPDPNHVFTGWWEAYSAKTFNQSRIVFTVDKNYQWTPWYSGSTTDSAILELEVDPHGAVDVYYDSSTNPAAKDPNSPFTSAVKVHRFSLANGLDLTLHAKPDSGYTFKGWYDVDNQLISTANIHSFTVNGNEYYHAVFYNSIPVSSVSVNPPTATLEVGDLAAQDKKTVQLTATVSPSDATDKSITWTTSDNTVAKVDANGLVTAVSTGSATITATASNGKSATASITVVSKQSIPVSSVSVNPPTTTLEVGDLAAQDKKSIQLTATVFPSDATNKSITWTTSDNAIAKVDANGLVTAVSAGTATITATASNGKSASSVITVISKQSIPVSSVSVNPPTATLEVGDLAAQDKKTVQLTATVSPTDATNKSITWTSSNNTVAKVDTNGLVTAVSAGTATITATASNGKSASSAITVVSKQSIPVSSVSVNPPTATLEVGDLAAQHKKTVQLTATVSPSDATNKNIIWTTSDNAVAKVDANGLVTAVSPGVATITATSVNGKSATASITVVLKQSIPVSSVSVNPPTATLEVGDLAAQNKKTVQLTATVSPSDATNKSINWTTSDNTVVKVDANGLVTAVSHGVATITATSINGKSATASITVVLKQSIPVSSVSVNPPTAALEVGDLAAQNKKTVQLTATVSPSDATNKSITWTSSNNTVAKVDANGLVTAVSAGSATITATASNGKSDTASITVVSKQSIPVSSVSVNPPTATLEVGDLAAQDKKTIQLIATVSPSDATNKSITWTSSNNAVAKVDANGLVTAVSPEVATITATSVNGKSATASITVVSKQSIPVSSLSVNPPTATLEVGDLAAQDKKTVQLTATVNPSDATNKSITWTTSDNAVAKVDANGLVTAVSPGVATIIATSVNGKSASSVITVVSKQSIPVSSVSVNPPTATLEVGDLAAQDKKTIQLTATVSPSDATNKNITWTTSDNTVAKVDANGLVTAVSAGTATITATASNGKSASSAITVVSKQSIPVSSVSVNPPTATLEVGDLAAQDKKTVQLTATVNPSDATNKSITWTTSDNAVAKVDANGLVTAVSPGVATIIATSVNGKSASSVITVVSKQSIPVSSVSVNPPTATVEVGDLAEQDKKTVQLTATVSPSDATNKSITWTTSDITIAKVDAKGLVTAVSAGTATITATASNGKSATASITVVSKQSIPVSSVSVNPPTATLEVGDLASQDKKTVQLTATVSPSDATNKSITWTSSDNTVAKVDANGVVTAVSAGTATITATASNGKSATASITVVSKQSIPVSSVSVNPPTATLEVGDLAAQDKKSIQLTATVSPSDATNKSITWTTSDNAVAKVDANGLVTAVSPGVATITATSVNGKSATASITVVSKQSIPVSSVSVNPPTATLEVGDLAAQDKKAIQLTATVSPSDATNKSITWTSSNNAVAKVDTNGLVTAVSAGTATITAAASNGKSATTSITVVSKQSVPVIVPPIVVPPTVPVSSVSVSPGTATLEVGDLAAQDKKAIQLTAAVSPGDATNKSITWTSSNDTVAKVDTNGLVTAVGAGTATITATSSNGKTASSAITVVSKQSVPVTSVSVNPGTATLEVGDLAAQDKKTVQLTATVLPNDATNKTITWTSSNNAIAKVDANGLVTATGAGAATITATSSNGKTANTVVTVIDRNTVEEPKIVYPLASIKFYDPYIVGYKDKTFRPQNNITRAEMAAIFARILKLDLNEAGQQQYSDVSSKNHWAYKYIQAISKVGIFSGYKDGTFKPDQPISRAEIAAVFVKYWDIIGANVDASKSSLKDVTGHWSETYIHKAFNAGLIQGFSDSTFKPDDKAKREQVVVLVNKMIGRPKLIKESSSFIDLPVIHWASGEIEAATVRFEE